DQPCATQPSIWPAYTPRRARRCCRNVAAELERDIARLGLVIGQIKQIEDRATPKMRHREAKQWPPATMMSQSFGTAPWSSLTPCRGIARSIDPAAAACLAPSASRTSYLAT